MLPDTSSREPPHKNPYSWVSILDVFSRKKENLTNLSEQILLSGAWPNTRPVTRRYCTCTFKDTTGRNRDKKILYIINHIKILYMKKKIVANVCVTQMQIITYSYLTC